ncbi:MAG: hypothetical protein QOI89_393, partial [Solirubrobacteraceae bacterium]|nr:hypothetical protein [Solirubrobacteraceae bacterium]
MHSSNSQILKPTSDLDRALSLTHT